MCAQVPESADRGLRLRLPATASSLAVFRERLREWLRSQGLQPADIFEIVLASSESLALVIEDRPRQVSLVVEVTAELEGDRVVITTRDYGLWQEPPPLDRDQLLGIALMQAFMDSVEIDRHHDGQAVTLVKRIRLASR
jgi:anti-sigma regulatory factor (Ser/Thr protein kinase)